MRMRIKSTITKTCFGQKQLSRDGNLTFTRCPGVGNLTLTFLKMSNSPGSPEARRIRSGEAGFAALSIE